MRIFLSVSGIAILDAIFLVANVAVPVGSKLYYSYKALENIKQRYKDGEEFTLEEIEQATQRARQAKAAWDAGEEASEEDN